MPAKQHLQHMLLPEMQNPYLNQRLKLQRDRRATLQPQRMS
jgi:hypothetical protein